ncbi:MAG: 50S ribosomal protein L18e [archaeon]
MKATGPTRLEARKTIALLEMRARKEKRGFWEKLAEETGKPRRRRAEVSAGKLEMIARKAKGKILVVPGKVLGNGVLESALQVVAVEFSLGAKKKILEKKGKCVPMREFALSGKHENAVIVK